MYILPKVEYYDNKNKIDKLLRHSFLVVGLNFMKKRLIYAIKDIDKFFDDYENSHKDIIEEYIMITVWDDLKIYLNDLAYGNESNDKKDVYDYIKDEIKSISENNMEVKNANEILWLRKYERDSYPNNIILNGNFYSTRRWTPGSELTSEKMSYRYNLQYWLDFSIDDLPYSYRWSRESNEEKYDILASIEENNNKINITLPEDIKKVRILLNEKKLDLTKNVIINSKSYKPKPNLKIMVRTLLERGDINYIFLDQYDYEKQ